MTNLLHETREALDKSGHTIADVTFIGSADHQYGFNSWEEFASLADARYDSGFGGQEVATDLVIEFSDGKSMWRAEYDGSEWWEYPPMLTEDRPKQPKPIRKIIGGSWVTIAEQNQEQAS
jgi:hypothetical protein